MSSTPSLPASDLKPRPLSLRCGTELCRPPLRGGAFVSWNSSERASSEGSRSGLEEFGVKGVGRALALEKGGDVLGGGEAHAATGFSGGGAEMRGEDHVGTFEAGVNEGFLFENIEASTSNFL